MGTNYYLNLKGNFIERMQDKQPITLHIGKSSGGWCFSLHVIPERGINSLRDWYRLWRRDCNVIKNEYGDVMSIREMLSVITERKWDRKPFKPFKSFNPFVKTAFYLTEEDFFDRNSAEPGPNGLLRHKICDDGHCVGHGGGTWDLIAGDFS